MKRPILIVAWGNAGRCDDGVGLALADRVADRYSGDELVEVVACHQLGPELAAELDGRAVVVFTDAHVRSAGPEVAFECVGPARSMALDTHHCSPGVLLRLCEALEGRAPEARLLTICAHDTSFGDRLSEPTRRAMRVAEKLLITFLEDSRERAGRGRRVTGHA